MIELLSSSETELCVWGCGRPARFFSDKARKPKWTCSRQWQKCPAKIKVGREKYTRTMIERHGVAVPTKDPACDAIRRQTNLKRYGAEHPMQSKKVQRKAKRTIRDRYGVDYSSQVPGASDKANVTRRKNGTLGGDLKKKIATCRANYGVDWPTQNPEVFRHNIESCFKHKIFVLPSGAIVFLQGYEPYVLTHILENGYSEYEFLWRNKPSFLYLDKNGKKRRYHPDFVFPGRKSIIEVKARKWFDRDRDEIVRKGEACQAAGWEFTVAVMGNYIRKRKANPIEFVPFRLLKQE